MSITLVLVIVALVLFASIALNRISGKIGVPRLLAFILLGMLLGEEGLGKISFDNFSLAKEVCTIALIFIMFYGGFGTNWKTAKPAVAKASLLSTLGVILTAGIVGVFCFFVLKDMLKMDILYCFLLSSVMASTDAASVFFVLRSKKLSLKHHTSSLLELESGSNDPASYMLTVVFISVIQGLGENGAGVSAGQIIYQIFAQICYGGVMGIVIAVAVTFLLTKFRNIASDFDMILVFAVAIFAYAMPELVGGNGYLSVYIVGIILGNSKIKNKKKLVPFFDGVTDLMQILIFFLLGLLCTPSALVDVLLPSFIIMVFMTLVARPLSVFSIMKPFRSPIKQIAVVSWAGLRGAASIVFAIMAHISIGSPETSAIFHIVFCIVLYSILIQGTFLPLISKKIGMIDKNSDVMKTFSDYTDEMPVRFIQFTINENHSWANCLVKDIVLPPETILVLIMRGQEKIIPRGKTVIENGDVIVLSAVTSENVDGIRLVERKASVDDIGKKIADFNKGSLIIMIKRGSNVVIPRGNTVVKKDDILVYNEVD